MGHLSPFRPILTIRNGFGVQFSSILIPVISKIINFEPIVFKFGYNTKLYISPSNHKLLGWFQGQGRHFCLPPRQKKKSAEQFVIGRAGNDPKWAQNRWFLIWTGSKWMKTALRVHFWCSNWPEMSQNTPKIINFRYKFNLKFPKIVF